MVTLNDIIDAQRRPEAERFRLMTLDELTAAGPAVFASDDLQLRHLYEQECRARILDKTALGLPREDPEP
jgi:hypothetical protein